MNEPQKVESIIEKGKLRYVLFHGAALFGLLSATLTLLIRVVIGDEVKPIGIGITYIVFPAVGIFWGSFMWKYITRRCQAGDRKQTK